MTPLRQGLAATTLLAAATTGLAGVEAPVRHGPLQQGCTLLAHEHRSGLQLLHLLLPHGAAPQLQLAFTHSVLGTPVQDHYTWSAGAWQLTEERFEGDGYGLPHAAVVGETLQRFGAGSRLLLSRTVAPLVVRPLPELHMRLLLPDGRQWLLGSLSSQAIELTISQC